MVKLLYCVIKNLKIMPFNKCNHLLTKMNNHPQDTLTTTKTKYVFSIICFCTLTMPFQAGVNTQLHDTEAEGR